MWLYFYFICPIPVITTKSSIKLTKIQKFCSKLCENVSRILKVMYLLYVEIMIAFINDEKNVQFMFVLNIHLNSYFSKNQQITVWRLLTQ